MAGLYADKKERFLLIAETTVIYLPQLEQEQLEPQLPIDDKSVSRPSQERQRSIGS